MPANSLPTPPDFLGCAALSEVRLSFASPRRVRSVRAWFLGSTAGEAWNSWIRSPRLPPPGTLSLIGDGQVLKSRELRFVASFPPGAPLPSGNATLLELRCEERQLSEVILRIPAGRFALGHLEAADSDYCGVPLADETTDVTAPPPAPPDSPDLPRHGDFLGEKLRTLLVDSGRPQDAPTLEDIWQLALPYRGGALLGIPEGPLAYQLPDGSLVLRPEGRSAYAAAGDRVLLQLFRDGRPLLAPRPVQRLRHGYLPVGEVQLQAADFSVTEVAFVDESPALRVELVCQNRSPHLATLSLQAVAARRLPAQNDPTLQAEIHTPLACQLSPFAAGDELRFSLQAPPAAATFSVPGNSTLAVALRLPLEQPARAAPVQSADSESFLAAGARLELPDPHFMNLWRALLLHTRLFIRDGVMRYGLFPGLYEDALFGIEEGWNIVALAQYGHAAAAIAALTQTFFTAEFLKKEGPHHQYRNGLAITYALDVYTLTGKRELLLGLWPTIRDSAEWIAAACASTRVLEDGVRPPHYGLMPKHIYGGDLRTPAYSVYASSACWRGLRDAARVARILGEEAAAAEFFAAAAMVRADILTAAERIYCSNGQPPYLPFRTDETAETPSSGEYYQLFASLVLETAVFGWRGRFAYALTDYLAATGRQVLGVPRFDSWFSRPGIDAEYARGSQLAALIRRDFAGFFLGMLGQIALSCDPHTFVSPETAIVRFTDAEQRERLRILTTQAARADSDPCSAGTGVMLQYLRDMLLTEEKDEDDLPTGTLWLAPAVPAAWFQPGQHFAALELPTAFGPVSYRCATDNECVVYDIDSAAAISAEVFYRDRDGRPRSTRARVEGPTRLKLPRT